MKIACVTDLISMNAGGMAISISSLMQAMIEAAPADLIRVFGIADSITQEVVPKWRPMQLRIRESVGPKRFAYSPKLMKDLVEFAPEVICSHGIWTYHSLVCLRMHKRFKIPTIINPHGMLDPWAVKNSGWKKRLVAWLYEREHLESASCIRALCESEAKAIRGFGIKKPIAIIPNGINLIEEVLETEELKSRATEGSIAARRKLLYLGRLHPKKGLVNLIHAWADGLKTAPNHFKNWQLQIAGWDEGGHESKLKKLATELNIRWTEDSADGINWKEGQSRESEIVFLGKRFGQQKTEAYQDCDAFILPSFSEGLPMVILEAWAFGKPVLMTEECNIPAGFAHDAAIRIEPDPKSILSGLLKLLEKSDQERLAMGSRGLALVKSHFSWSKIGHAKREVCEWVVNGGSVPSCVLVD